METGISPESNRLALERVKSVGDHYPSVHVFSNSDEFFTIELKV